MPYVEGLVLPTGRCVLLATIWASVLLWGTPLDTYAQAPSSEPASPPSREASSEPRYSVALVGVPLAHALERLIDETQLSIVYTSRLVADRTTFCKAERVAPETLLSCILDETGLDYIRLSSGTYVVRASPRTPPLYGRLSGQVVDAQTGMPLADANVLLARAEIGMATNDDGRFAFPSLPPGSHSITVTHVAYHDAIDTVYVGPTEERRVELTLHPQIVLAEPVVVNGLTPRLPYDRLGTTVRSGADLSSAEGLSGAGVVQALDAVTGVRLGDALSDVHVQGGASNEQQFRLDGVPVFMPVSSGGFISSFSPFALGQVTVRKAGFGVPHGSFLSGVIDVDHKLGSGPRMGFAAQVNPLSLNGRWTGRLGTGRSGGSPRVSWMLAGRRGLWDWYQPRSLRTLFESWSEPDRFLESALRDAAKEPASIVRDPGVVSSQLEVAFVDVHGAARVRLSDLSSLHVSFYRGVNAFGTEGQAPAEDPTLVETSVETDVFEDAYRWRNHAGQVSYEWVASGRLFMNIRLWGSDYRLNHPTRLGSTASSSFPVPSRADSSSSAYRSDEFNRISEGGMRIRGDWAFHETHSLSAALEAAHTRSDFSLSLNPFGAAPAGPSTVAPVRWRFASFVEGRLSVTPRTTLTLGTRLSHLPAQKTVFGEPRIALKHDGEVGARGTWAVRGALGLYRQYLHSFDVATYNVAALLPRVRFWLPIGQAQRPPEAYHATASVVYRPDDVWEFGAESYYKHQPHLLVLDYGASDDARTLGTLMTDADGYAYGASASASRTSQRVQLAAQYEYTVARRRIDNRFDGNVVPVPWDAPHRLYLSADVHPLRHWTVTLRWQGVFGRSWGFRRAYYDFLEPNPETRRFGPFDLSDPAAHTLPEFSQWDVGLAYAREVAGVGVQGRVTFINVLGRDNVSDWSLHYDERDRTYVRDPRLAASFIPSVSLRLSLQSAGAP